MQVISDSFHLHPSCGGETKALCFMNYDLGVIMFSCVGFLLAGVAGVRPAPARPTIQERERSDRANGQVTKEEDEEEDGDSESSEDWEEVDGNEMSDEESIEEVKADGDGLGPSEGELQEWDPSCCFFCDAKSADGSIEGCVEHMHKVHGFFIPDSEYLKDPRGMLSYLGLKVVQSSY